MLLLLLLLLRMAPPLLLLLLLLLDLTLDALGTITNPQFPSLVPKALCSGQAVMHVRRGPQGYAPHVQEADKIML